MTGGFILGNGAEDPAEATADPWVKLRVLHEDSWQTPAVAEGISIYVDETAPAAHADLRTTTHRSVNRNAYSAQAAFASAQEEGGVVVKSLPPTANSVLIEIKGKQGIEQQMHACYQDIEQTLATTYQSLCQAMVPYMEAWQQQGWHALLTAAQEGGGQGVSGWLEDQKQWLDMDAWQDLAAQLGQALGHTLDSAYVHSNQAFSALDQALHDDQGEFHSMRWFALTAADATQTMMQTTVAQTQAAIAGLEQQLQDVYDDVAYLEKLWAHRMAIYALPEAIAYGHVDVIEDFIDSVLMDIDPEWASDLQTSPYHAIALALIADPHLPMLYSGYLLLFKDAIPPNFYVFYFGKVGGYLILEVILTLVLGLVSGGVAAAARMAAVTARITKIVQSSEKSCQALQAFQQTLTTFTQVLARIEEYARLIVLRPLPSIKGPVRQTLVVKQRHPSRQARCRLCGSHQHATPFIPGKGVLVHK